MNLVIVIGRPELFLNVHLVSVEIRVSGRVAECREGGERRTHGRQVIRNKVLGTIYN